MSSSTTKTFQVGERTSTSPLNCGFSCLMSTRTPLRAEPNFQPELDETPEPCVSSRHDAAKRTIGTSIGEDVLRPQEVGIVPDEHEIRSVNRVRIEAADVARAKNRLAVVESILQVGAEFDHVAFRHSGFLKERNVPVVQTRRIQRVSTYVGPSAWARPYKMRCWVDRNIADCIRRAADAGRHVRRHTRPAMTANGVYDVSWTLRRESL